MDLERQFWLGDADFYRENLDDECLLAFAEMAGVSTRDQVAETVKEGDRWQDVHMEVIGVIEPAKDVALVTYEATATQSGGEPYAALVSSGYVRRGGAWKMAFHQQTPRETGAVFGR